MKTIISAMLLLLAGVLAAFPQQKLKFSVSDFGVDNFDTTAKDDRHKRMDGSGSLYSIIKVTSDSPNDNLNEYNFNFGNMNCIVENHDDQLWLYVQKNAKMVTITRSGYTPLRNYDLHTTIEAGKTYIMHLSAQGPVVYTQMVMFKVQPANAKATVMIRQEGADSQEEVFGITDAEGNVANPLEYGTYTYRVMATNYYSTEGRFSLNNQDETHIETVNLRSNGAVITLSVSQDAEIYVNGARKGIRSWKGILKAGTYNVECRQPNYRSSSQNITVTEGKDETITLMPPTPITGRLSINSSPLNATIKSGGRVLGTTPKIITDMLIGKHEIVLSREGYEDATTTVELKEGETFNVNLTLKERAKSVTPVASGGTVSAYNNTITSNIDVKQYPFRRVGKCPMTDMLNPMDGGIILGWTTMAEAVAAGGVSKPRKDIKHTLEINGRTYWDHDGDGIIKSLYFTHNDGMPEQWSKVGLSFSLSYNQWLDWFRKHGFVVEITSEPKSGSSFSAKVEASNLSQNLTFKLDFDYGNGRNASDSNTLYSISLSRKRIHTSTTDYSPYLPIDGVTPGVTTANQLPHLGIEMNSRYEWGSKGERDYFYEKKNNNKVYKINIEENCLPSEWLKSGNSDAMTYNRWIQFFSERGFKIKENQPLNSPNSRYPKLEAIHPQLGIRVEISFRRSFNIATEGDNSEIVWYYDIYVL